MKILLVSFLFLLINPEVQDQELYVCMPCGYDCDEEEHTSPGTCHACGMALVKKGSIKFTNVSVDDFCKRMRLNPTAVLLDVRSPAEFNGTLKERPSFGHFSRAININVEELEARIGELSKYKNREILVYCSQSHRSPRASYLLGLQGFSNVKNMSGGVSTFTPQTSPDCLKKEFVYHAQ